MSSATPAKADREHVVMLIPILGGRGEDQSFGEPSRASLQD
jgi:hypothetical protein